MRRDDWPRHISTLLIGISASTFLLAVTLPRVRVDVDQGVAFDSDEFSPVCDVRGGLAATPPVPQIIHVALTVVGVDAPRRAEAPSIPAVARSTPPRAPPALA